METCRTAGALVLFAIFLLQPLPTLRPKSRALDLVSIYFRHSVRRHSPALFISSGAEFQLSGASCARNSLHTCGLANPEKSGADHPGSTITAPAKAMKHQSCHSSTDHARSKIFPPTPITDLEFLAAPSNYYTSYPVMNTQKTYGMVLAGELH
ncbi:hypothetical protein G7046_g8221 [Stylonectria norvegica]|nr:hypothetical protein G7046_g8221 [Stylonectria norvegica]